MKFTDFKDIYTFIFSLLIFILPLESIGSAVPNIMLGLIVLLFPFIVKKSDFIQFRRKEFLILLLLVVYLTVRLLIIDPIYELKFIKKILPVLIIFVCSIPIKKTSVLKYSFIIGVFISIAISLVNIVFVIKENPDFQFADGSIVNNALSLERIYIGFVVCISLIFSFELCNSIKRGKLKFLLYANILIGFIFLFIIVARMAILTSFIILFFNGYRLFTKTIFRILYLSLVAACVILIGWLNVDNISKRVHYKGTLEESIEWAEHREPRVLIWSCSLKFLQSREHNFFFGNGHDEVQTFLNNCYMDTIPPKYQYKEDVFIRNEYNTHNQYLDFFSSTGVIGVVLLVLLMITYCYTNYWKMEVVLAIASLAMFIMIENIFHRQLGFYLVAVLLVMISPKLEESN